MRYIIVLFCFMLPPWAEATTAFNCQGASDKEPKTELLGAVEKRYSEIKDLQAEFYQETYFVGLDQRVSSRGRVRFKKPGKMDWVYSEPEKQRFITDGKKLWYYQPDFNQVKISDFGSSFSSDLPVSFLLGIGSLKKNFELVSSCGAEHGVLLQLKARKPDPSLSQFLLLIRTSDKVPLGAKVVDIGGTETAIRFIRLKSNVGLPDETFAFKIPKGVDIIDPRSEAGQVSSVLAIPENEQSSNSK